MSTEEVLAEMRAGASIMTGGSRCHTTYFHRAGEWWIEHFDEGAVEEVTTREATIRDVIELYPDKARVIIRKARWRPFSEAFLAGGDPTRALELLSESRRFGQAFRHAEILEAFLRFPSELDPELADHIRSELRGFTAYHCFMEAACWDRSPEAGRKGVLFVDRLIEMVGVCPGCFKVRASFHEQAGDHAAAVQDLERELAQTERETWNHEFLTGLLARARARAAKS